MTSESNSLLSSSRGVTLFGKKIPLQDIAALAAFLVLFGWFCYVIRFGVNAVDEGLYYNITQRLLRGERLLVDEWQVSQFSSFLLVLPVKLYLSVVGSAQGMILFMRGLYVAETAVLYWWLYTKYRRFGYGGLAGVALFCFFVPGDMFAVFYLTMAIQGLMVFCTLLFLPREKPMSPFGWVFSGIVFACTVLAQPPFCLIYFAYCGIVLVRRIRKRGQGEENVPLLQPRVWMLLTAGIVLTAIPVVLYFLLKSTVPEIIRIFPELFTDSEYDFRFEHFYNLIWKSLILGQTFGYENAFVWAALIAACGGMRLMQKKELHAGAPEPRGKKKAQVKKTPRLNAEQLRRIIFIAACVCLATSYIAGIFSFAEYKADVQSHQLYMYHFYHSAPVAAFCAVCCLLLKQKSPFAEAFWWIVVTADLLIAYGSECACRLAGVALFPMMFILARRLIAELNAAGKTPGGKHYVFNQKRFRVIVGAVSAASLCAMLCFESIGGYIARFYLPTEHYESGRTDLPLDCTLQRGPLKGVITNSAVKHAYDACLADLDQLGSEGPVYIMGTCPYLYLHLEQEMGTYSSWYVDDDAFARQLRFMQLLPEKRPAVVYIPFVDFVTYRIPAADETDGAPPLYDQKLDWVRQYAECTVTTGGAGYIVHVSQWNLPPVPEP